MSTSDWLRTGIGATTADSITIRGRDLAGELMGSMTFTELSFLLVQGAPPTPGQARLLDAVLVSLADHGLTPTVLAARLTYTGAPESLQGAVAAGLLGAGSVFLGVVEDAAVFLEQIGAASAGGTEADLRAAAEAAVDRRALWLDRPSPRPPGHGPCRAASPATSAACSRYWAASAPRATRSWWSSMTRR